MGSHSLAQAVGTDAAGVNITHGGISHERVENLFSSEMIALFLKALPSPRRWYLKTD